MAIGVAGGHARAVASADLLRHFAQSRKVLDDWRDVWLIAVQKSSEGGVGFGMHRIGAFRVFCSHGKNWKKFP